MKLLYFCGGGGSKITADSDCSHEIKRRLPLWMKKSYDQPKQRIKKQRHYFVNKCLVAVRTLVSTSMTSQLSLRSWSTRWSLTCIRHRHSQTQLLLCGWPAGDAQQSWLFLQLDALTPQTTLYPRRVLGSQLWPPQHSPLNPRSSVQGVLLKLWALSQCWEGGCLRWPSQSLCSLLKAMIFLVVMYGYESWTIKKAECQRIAAFELWCWRRQLRVPWTAGRSNQSILKEIGPEYSLEGLMLKLKLQYFGHLMWRTDSWKRSWC